VATELLEKALRENADTDKIFTTTMVAGDNNVLVSQGDSVVEEILRERQHEFSSKRNGRGGGASGSRTPGMQRRRLGDEPRGFEMEVSDDEGL
jgi:hypothetical protein